MNTFWDDKLPPDYYDTVLTTGLVKKEEYKVTGTIQLFSMLKKELPALKII